MLKIKGWSKAHDEADVTVIETVTRCQDPANNSNKYRRFISVWAPGEQPHVFTHTGRWTVECDSGHWNNVGTYRPGGLIRGSAWVRAVRAASTPGAAHMLAHEAFVARKLGEYKVTGGPNYLNANNANVKTWMNKAEAIESSTGTPTLGPTTPAPTAPATRPLSGQPPKAAPARIDPTADVAIMTRVQNVLQRSAAEGADPFDVMADVATLRGKVTAQITELQGLASDLALATSNAMERI